MMLRQCDIQNDTANLIRTRPKKSKFIQKVHLQWFIHYILQKPDQVDKIQSGVRTFKTFSIFDHKPFHLYLKQ